MRRNGRQRALFLLGLLLSTLPPIVATVLYFPIWKARGSVYVISGAALIILLISLIPLWRVIKKALASPSAYVIWLLTFILFFSLSKIADEVTVIAFWGFIGNGVGALLFNFSKPKKGVSDEEL